MKSDNSNGWSPDKFIKDFQSTLDTYQKEHPHWPIEVLVSLIGRGLLGLKQNIENPNKKEITWDNPFVELHYPVEWDWNATQMDGIVSARPITGKFTHENTCNSEMTRKTIGEILVRHLNTLALQGFTNNVWLEKHNGQENLTPILSSELCEKLNAIKNKKERQAALNQLARPFSIGAASIDYGETEFKEGAPVPKRVVEQLANIEKLIDIQRIGFNGNINGHKFEMSLIFQIHPLTIEYERKKAYHSITVGLFIAPQIIEGEIVSTTPAGWPKNDQETLWRELFQEVVKITDHLIPKAESQTSAILSINAKIEIPLARSNEAQKIALDALQKLGRVKDVHIKSALISDPSNLSEPQGKEEKVPASLEEGFVSVVWKSRFRWLILGIVLLVIVTFAVYSAQPDEVKIRILQYFGLSKSLPEKHADNLNPATEAQNKYGQIEAFVIVLQTRADLISTNLDEVMEALEKADPQKSDETKAVTERVQALKHQFLILHEKHIAAVREGNIQLAHELNGDIQNVLANIAQVVSSRVGDIGRVWTGSLPRQYLNAPERGEDRKYDAVQDEVGQLTEATETRLDLVKYPEDPTTFSK